MFRLPLQRTLSLRRSGRWVSLAAALTALIALSLACGPSQEPSSGGPLPTSQSSGAGTAATLPAATSLPTTGVQAEATDLPTAALGAEATSLPAAASIPASAEGTVMTVDAATAAQARERLERALRAPWATDFTRATIAFDEIMTGGPPKDGIPSIDDPQFESVADADEWLDELEAVQVVDINGDARAYPVQVMVWHELVNDTVGGEPVVITF